MDDKTKKEFIALFNQGFEEVVAPAIDDLRGEITQEFKDVKQRLFQVENRLEVLDRKVDHISAKQFDDQKQLRDQEKRVKNLEINRITA